MMMIQNSLNSVESSEDHTGEGADESCTEMSVSEGAEACEDLDESQERDAGNENGTQERQYGQERQERHAKVLRLLSWTDQGGRNP